MDLGRFVDKFQRRLRVVLEAIDRGRLAQAVNLIEAARRRGSHVLIFGNGGSAALAAHFASDLTMMASPGPSKVKAVSLATNLSVLTAWANDTDFTEIFVRQLETLAVAEDLVIAISSSGQSQNVVAAVEWALAHSLPTIGLVGFDGGRVKELVDCPLWLPSRDYAIVESGHGALIHLLASYLGQRARQAADRDNSNIAALLRWSSGRTQPDVDDAPTPVPSSRLFVPGIVEPE